MNGILIAFLLGISPNQESNSTIQKQWDSLSPQEQSMLVMHFEENYGQGLNLSDAQVVKQLKRDIVFRAIDHSPELKINPMFPSTLDTNSTMQK